MKAKKRENGVSRGRRGSRGRLGVVLSLGALLTLGGCRRAPADDIRISLEPYFRDLRIVRVQAGDAPLNLLFDTGGGATLITPGVARARGCEPRGEDVGHRMSGERVVFARCSAVHLTAGPWSATVAPVAVFDVNALLPKELPRLDGVLALDAFRGQVVTIDWPAGTVIVHGPGTADAAVAASGIPFRTATGESGRFLTALARVDGRHEPLWFLLDTGNLRGTLVASSVLRDALAPLRGSDMITLKIGGRPAVDAPFQAADLVLDGALGTDYFRRGPVTLDLRALSR